MKLDKIEKYWLIFEINFTVKEVGGGGIELKLNMPVYIYMCTLTHL